MEKRFKKTFAMNGTTKNVVEELAKKLGINENAVFAIAIWELSERITSYPR